MSELLKLFGGAILSLALCMILREAGKPWGEVISIVLAVAVTLRAAAAVGECAAFLRGVSADSEAKDYVPIVLKAGGIAFLTDFTARLCRGAGEAPIGAYVELAGRAELMLLALPLAGELLELSFGVLSF